MVGFIKIKLLSIFLFLSVMSYAQQNNWTSHVIDDSLMGADGVRASDFNNDGLFDLVVGWEQSGVTKLYLNSSSGFDLNNSVTLGNAPDVEDSFPVDLDGDGFMDAISLTEGEEKKVYAHWSPSKILSISDSKKWITREVFNNNTRWMYGLPKDMNGKNGIDLVIGGKGKNAVLGWLENPGNNKRKGKWKFHELTKVKWVMSIVEADLDNDGYLDLIVSDRKGKNDGVFWMKNPGKLVFEKTAWKKEWIVNSLFDTNFLDVKDINGDGIKEIAVTHKDKRSNKGYVSILTNDSGNWILKNIKNLPSYVIKPKCVKIEDLNLDGELDLIISMEKAEGVNGIIWIENQNGEFNEVHNISGVEGVKFDQSLVLDMDSDGDLDIVNTEENNNSQNGMPGLGLIWYENPIEKK